jgi:hypothetical protein
MPETTQGWDDLSPWPVGRRSLAAGASAAECGGKRAGKALVSRTRRRHC